MSGNSSQGLQREEGTAVAVWVKVLSLGSEGSWFLSAENRLVGAQKSKFLGRNA